MSTHRHCLTCFKPFRPLLEADTTCSKLCAEILIEARDQEIDQLRSQIRRLEEQARDAIRTTRRRAEVEPQAFTLEFIRKVVDGEPS